MAAAPARLAMSPTVFLSFCVRDTCCWLITGTLSCLALLLGRVAENACVLQLCFKQ
jgi:hypothetical protein